MLMIKMDKTEIRIHHEKIDKYYFSIKNPKPIFAQRDYEETQLRQTGYREFIDGFREFCLENTEKRKLYRLKFSRSERFKIIPLNVKKELAKIVGKINQDSKKWLPRNYQ